MKKISNKEALEIVVGQISTTFQKVVQDAEMGHGVLTDEPSPHSKVKTLCYGYEALLTYRNALSTHQYNRLKSELQDIGQLYKYQLELAWASDREKED